MNHFSLHNSTDNCKPEMWNICRYINYHPNYSWPCPELSCKGASVPGMRPCIGVLYKCRANAAFRWVRFKPKAPPDESTYLTARKTNQLNHGFIKDERVRADMTTHHVSDQNRIRAVQLNRPRCPTRPAFEPARFSLLLTRDRAVFAGALLKTPSAGV